MRGGVCLCLRVRPTFEKPISARLSFAHVIAHFLNRLKCSRTARVQDMRHDAGRFAVHLHRESERRSSCCATHELPPASRKDGTAPNSEAWRIAGPSPVALDVECRCRCDERAVLLAGGSWLLDLVHSAPPVRTVQRSTSAHPRSQVMNQDVQLGRRTSRLGRCTASTDTPTYATSREGARPRICSVHGDEREMRQAQPVTATRIEFTPGAC
ncbi:hypothetical protein C8Q80DRAFT_260395 [Daedaleopsis nitida]|nr:hypothetical protein C8Q80DRAFT_260395 [Daedaleopsis nitida]